MAGAGVEQRDRGAVAVPDQHGPLDAEPGEHVGQHDVGLVVHVGDRPRQPARARCGRSRGASTRASRGRPAADRTASGNPRHSPSEPRPSCRNTSGGRGGPSPAAVQRASRAPPATSTRMVSTEPVTRSIAAAAASRSRSAKRWILPVAVFGSSVTTSSRRGRLNAAIRSRQWASMAAASIVRPWRATRKATVTSRPASSRAPTTAASSTSGCSMSTASTSAGDTQMPPALIMSLLRPRNVQ